MQTSRRRRPPHDGRSAVGVGLAVAWLVLAAGCGTGGEDVSAPPLVTAPPRSTVANQPGSSRPSDSPPDEQDDESAPDEPHDAAPATTAVARPPVTVEQHDCPAPFPAQGLSCGLATVPLDRADPTAGSTTISLVAVPGEDPASSPPVAILQGGPGGASTELSLYYPPRSFTQVFIDQRGTGFGRADFDCPEVDEALPEILAAPSEVGETIELAAYERCAARLASDPVLVTADTATFAADVTDVMTALGYDRWLVYGVSYGTTIALQLMRTAPPGLAGAVLDGVYPIDLDVDVAIAESADSALAELDRACAADPSCDAMNPDVTGSLESLMERLDRDPITVELENPALEVVIDGQALAGSVFRFLYEEGRLRFVPGMLSGLEEGDAGTAEWLAETIVTLSIASLMSNDDGTWFAVQCADRLPFTDGPPDDMSPFAAAIAEPALEQLCEPWSRDPSPATLAAPVVSDLPTLIVGGQFDPITPPDFAYRVAADLSEATVAVRPGLGHGVWYGDDCVEALVDAFVADPGRALDPSCAAQPVAVDWSRPAG